MPPATSESFSARGEERRRRPKPPPPYPPPAYELAPVHVRAVRAGVSLYKTAVLPVASCVLCWREKKQPGVPASELERWHRCSDRRIRTCPNVSMQSSYYSNIWGREYLFPRAHRLTSLVMRLLFPPPRKLAPAVRKKKGKYRTPVLPKGLQEECDLFSRNVLEIPARQSIKLYFVLYTCES